MKSIYDQDVVKELTDRVNNLRPDTQAVWGKMDVAQMMAHCNVPYEMVFSKDASTKFKKPTGLKRWLVLKFVKPIVVGEKPYKKNTMTAPEFKIVDNKEFTVEQTRLLANLQESHAAGREFFEQRESPSFGAMTADEWSILYYKHLDHHLQQFGV